MEATPIFNLLVRLLDGKTLALKLTSPSVDGHALKHRLFDSTGIPPNHQRLVTGVRQIDDDSVISCSSGKFPTVHVLLRLVGGKGGFGSLLRGAATKAGQKKTNNFDACRDMSGRRLRHVNAEKRLEEWKAEEEERRLEKMADEFLKKKAKVGKKGVGDSAAHKYVQKYREESARCVAEVQESVRDAVMNAGNRKRKGGLVANGADSKKLKIWMGKRKMGESDSEDSDEEGTENEEESEKSVILNSGCQPDLNKDAEGSSDSVNCGKQGDVSGGASCESGSEEEKDLSVQESMELVGCSSNPHSEQIDAVEMNDQTTQGAVVPCSKPVPVSADQEIEVVKQDADEVKIVTSQKNRQDNMPGPNNGEIIEDLSTLPEPNGSPVQRLSDPTASSCNSEEEAPLNFDDFSSAAEMEVLGLERLKCELQARGLKCGGTLQERAARLFLLKSTPLDSLPKKLLARK